MTGDQLFSTISFFSKPNSRYMWLAKLSAVLLLLFSLILVADSSASAESIKRMFLGVKDVELSISVVADQSANDLIDERRLGARVLEQAKSILKQKNPSVPIRLVRHGSIPEIKRLNKGTLAIVLTLTVRSADIGVTEPSCCLGALSMRIDRDLVRRGSNEELVYTEDRYRMNFPPEPVFLGSDQSDALNQAVGASVVLLQPILSGAFR